MFIAEERKIIKLVNKIIKRDPQLIDETVYIIIQNCASKGGFQNRAILGDILELLGYITVIAENKRNRVKTNDKK